ncbi:hypothetical protein [Oceanobacillus senegalensis]|uniref:hypothetical protein n=1 Tax=Oceanobacillus senegalensis TaxID=1936063 RepID=UPI001C5019C3|nr:hypothetical protein [Oceanobacillus senegalensis]
MYAKTHLRVLNWGRSQQLEEGMGKMSSKSNNENIIEEARQEVKNIMIRLIENNVDISTILHVLSIDRLELVELKGVQDEEVRESKVRQSNAVTNTNRKRIKARKITKFPSNYKSELSKENERVIKLIRSLL